MSMDSQRGLRGRGPIIVGEPLAPFAGGLRRELAGQGYALDSIGDHVHLLADLSDWLSGQGLGPADLTTGVAEGFLRARRARGTRTMVSDRALAPTLRYLRGLQVVPGPAPVVAVTAQDVLLLEYRRHLEGERGLSEGTVRHYLRCARVFFERLPVPLTASLPMLSGEQVIEHVRWWIAQRQSGQRQGTDMVTLPALRSLLRYLHTAGYLPQSLAGAVPAGKAGPRGRGLPAAAVRDDIRRALAACDRDSAAGQRDYAIVVMMTRMGLRGGEVARLELGDVNWRGGELTIRGKGARVDVLPLPADVGQAMAEYLMQARPTTVARTLFVT
jgi:integrase/recombinase XerD